jgi:hypothetical protein
LFIGDVLLLINVSTAEGEALLFCGIDKYLATTPVTCGDAMDVPLSIFVDELLEIQSEVIEVPGAKISKIDP